MVGAMALVLAGSGSLRYLGPSSCQERHSDVGPRYKTMLRGDGGSSIDLNTAPSLHEQHTAIQKLRLNA